MQEIKDISKAKEKNIIIVKFILVSGLFTVLIGLIFYFSFIFISTVGINISNHGWKFIRLDAFSRFLIKSSLGMGVLVFLTLLTSVFVKRFFYEMLNQSTKRKNLF